jgi:hypothetical protein
MPKKTNNEKLSTPLKSPKKSDVKRPVKDNEERTTTTFEDLTK